jgi:nucleotide-binding universal stress UspA family protein
MNKSKRTLVATDFSPLAQEAIRQAHEIAASLQAPLAVCHVVQNELKSNMLFPHLTKPLLLTPLDLDRIREAISANVKSITGRADGQFEILVDDGTPYAAILALAESWRADLIVIGSHGSEDLYDLMLGGVAKNVIRYAHCPVLIARPHKKSGHIVAGTDFSDHALFAVEAAVEEARRNGSRLTIVHSIQVSLPVSSFIAGGVGSPPPEPSVEESKELKNAVEDRLVELVARFGFPAEPRVLDGPAEPALIRVAKETNADLLVVGTKGRTGLARVLLGSVAEGAVRSAPCSVLVVRH